MHKFLFSYKESRKLFLGDTDSYTIIQNGYTEDKLIFEIKLAALLYDVVFIPAAYMWQSYQMKEIMYKIQPLILTENVLPVIRKTTETRDIQDYFEKRQSETEKLKTMEVFKIPSLATEFADPKHEKDMKFLNDLNSCLHLEDKSVKEEFINLWKCDLESGDINAIPMILYRSNLDISTYKMILYRLKVDINYSNFSRSTLIDYILKLSIPQDVKNMLQERISWLYLMANAIVSESDFYISKSYNNKLVHIANLDIYLQLLKNFGIDEKMIQLISLEDLLRIKFSPEYINFITNYNSLVRSISFEQMSLVQQTNMKIHKMICKEDRKRRIWNKISAVYGISGSIFLGLLINYFSGSEISKNAAVVSMGTTAASGILKRIMAIDKSISSPSFYDFKEFIIKEEYKKKMQKSINGVIL